MQRTFLRSDSEDLVRLQQYFQSTVTRSLQHDFQTFGILNKLLSDLEKARRECGQLIGRNKHLEESLRQTNRELHAAKERIERLIAENQTLSKSVQKSSPRRNQNQQKVDTSHHSQQQQPQRMVTSSTTNGGGRAPGNSRKRIGNDGVENEDIFDRAAKRSLLRKSSESEENATKMVLGSIDENSTSPGTDKGGQQSDQQQYYSAKDTTTLSIATINNTSKKGPPSQQRPPRRSMSVEPMPMVTPIISSTMRPHPRQSRMMALRNSRVSSSHGDLSRVVIQQQQQEMSPPDDYMLAGGDHANHSFQTKRNFLRTECGKCDMVIRFGVLYVKCQRCKATFHEPCRIQAPLPCVIRKMTPKPMGVKQGFRLRLGDFCTDIRPMVPPLITYCCFHLDNHPALPFEDIYQLDGDAQEVECITKLFASNKTFPKLETYHPMNVAGCIKKFLAQIREPVIGQSYGKEIIKCLSSPTTADNLPSHVEDLPIAHIDTLAHLCRHWKRLIGHSNGQLTAVQLAECIGPLVFGTNRPNSSLPNDAVIQAMVALIDLRMDYWVQVSNSPAGGTSRSNTPLLLSRNPSQRSNRGGQTPLRIPTLPKSTRYLNQPQQKQPEVAFDSTMNSQSQSGSTAGDDI